MFEQTKLANSPFRIPEKHESKFSSLEFNLPDTKEMTDDQALQYLAKILIEWYIEVHDDTLRRTKE